MNYDTLATKESLEKAVASLTANGFMPEIVENGAAALSRIKELIPAGASVMNGSSTTLNQIGYVDYLKEGKHGWNNLHDAILAEKDPAKQAELRKSSVSSDYYVGSTHGVSETGELLIASNSGSQLPHLAFTSSNIILVVGSQKLTPSMAGMYQRLNEHVLPLEDARMKSVGMGGSFISKILVLNKEQSFMGRKFHIVFVKEKLGF